MDSQKVVDEFHTPSTVRTYDLALQNLLYKVNVKDEETAQRKERILLNGVTAQARHGQVLAVFGPSGSGKTTLLDALAGRIKKTSLEGSILVNGNLIDSKFRRMFSYVMQNDALYPLLTVKETLLYTARLKLRGKMTHQERLERVEHVIRQLGLKSCANTKVGDDLIRGVSGGERRRVSIGVDVIHDPAVLLLDEPTSGLDSTSALQVMEHLSAMAEEHGRTIILTIHQPGHEVLATIHNCLVLVQGNVIFHGPPDGMINYFSALGHIMPQHITAVEYFLQVVSECKDDPKGLETLIKYYEEKAIIALTRNELLDQNAMSAQIRDRPQHYARSFVAQTGILIQRTLLNTLRTKELFIGRLTFLIVGACVVGSLFFHAKLDSVGIRQRQSFFGFSLSFVIFTSSQTLSIAISERQIFIRETTGGAYSALAYVFSGSLVILPFMLVFAVVFSGISYWIVGLAHSATAFLFSLLVYFLVFTTAASFVECVAGLIHHLVTANGIIQGCFSLSFLISGYFIQRNAIPPWWLPIHYLSLHKYPYEALMKNEFSSYHHVDWDHGEDSQDVLDSLSLGKVHKWQNMGILIVFIVAYRSIYYFYLLWTRKHTRK